MISETFGLILIGLGRLINNLCKSLLSVRRPIETSLVIYDFEHGLGSILFLTYFWGGGELMKIGLNSCILFNPISWCAHLQAESDLHMTM
jgi:hypothetical protein